jgi:lipopolysaccharide biosynthesis glycosyltransferase
MEQKIIPVFFSFNKQYMLPAAVAIHSLLKYANKQYCYQLYVLHDELTQKNQHRLMKIVASFKENASIEFLDMGMYRQNFEWNQIINKRHYSKESCDKLMADILFPQYDKIICSDVDVVYQNDISKSYFYHQNHSFFVEGVRDDVLTWHTTFSSDFTEDEKRNFNLINGGFIVFNLKEIRKNKIGEKMREYYKANLSRLIYVEQDVINLCCYPHIGILPFSHMVYPSYYSARKKKQLSNNAETEEISEALENPILIHYLGCDKPWNSFFLTKQNTWLNELYQTGFIIDYICTLPHSLIRIIKRYNLIRFIGRMKKKIKTKIKRNYDAPC